MTKPGHHRPDAVVLASIDEPLADSGAIATTAASIAWRETRLRQARAVACRFWPLPGTTSHSGAMLDFVTSDLFRGRA